MAKSQVSTLLPIEFSEVCEVVYQDLLGTNGRSLSGCFAVANASGKTYDSNYVGIKDRLSNFRGFPVIVPGDSVYFDADYAIIEYNFVPPGDDLDTRTGFTSPVASGYVGWGTGLTQYSTFLKWGGDNLNSGVETAFIDIVAYKAQYPTQNMMVDLRAFWYDVYSATPVVFKVTLYKGGTPVAPNMTTAFDWQVTNPTNLLILQTLQKEIKLNVTTAPNIGQKVATFEYNPSTFIAKVTPVTDNTPPTAPTLSVQATGNGTITLAWSGSTDANAPIKYCLWALEDNAGTAIPLAKNQSKDEWWNITSPFVVTVTNGVARHFYVRAFDPTGNYSVNSNTVTATATATDTTPPSQVTGLIATGDITTWIDLSWDAATDNIGVTGYVYQWSYNGSVWNLGDSTTQLSIVFMAPDTNTQYYFRVQAYDAEGNFGAWSAQASAWSGDIIQ